jgi:hypothetical protein
MGRRSAHREKGDPVYLKNLPAHQMQDMLPDLMDIAALPLPDGVSAQQVKFS